MEKSSVRSPARILIQGIGNPLRSDDALGPQLIMDLQPEVAEMFGPAVEMEWVYQLQIEHAELWSHYDSVVVVDAAVNQKEQLNWRELTPTAGSIHDMLCSHQQPPEAIHDLMKTFFRSLSSPRETKVFVLGMSAKHLALGEKLTHEAESALGAARIFLLERIAELVAAGRSQKR
jgi:hydrogenase maturation protease